MLRNQALESRIKQKFTTKVVSSTLEYTILGHFENVCFTGYEALTFVRDTFGVLLSASTVYSALYLMEREGLLSGSLNGRKRVFKITDWGKLNFEILAAKADLEEFMSKILVD